jgi:hypothetical protein
MSNGMVRGSDIGAIAAIIAANRGNHSRLVTDLGEYLAGRNRNFDRDQWNADCSTIEGEATAIEGEAKALPVGSDAAAWEPEKADAPGVYINC